MDEPGSEWEQRLAVVLAAVDSLPEDEFLAAVLDLTTQLPADHPVGLFERAGAYDSTGHPDVAVPLYEQALAGGLAGVRRRRAVIQLASSRRNLGDPQAALALLDDEAGRTSDDLDAAVATFRALVLADLGREREGLAAALTALAGYLPRYQRSAARYAEALLEPRPADPVS